VVEDEPISSWGSIPIDHDDLSLDFVFFPFS
jgi:hypothetical protein